MQVTLKKQYKGIEITISGNENEDLVQKLADTISKVDYDSVATAQTPAQAQPVTLQINEDGLEHLVKLNESGPVLQAGLVNRIASGTQQDKQAKAFMLLAYMLTKKYDGAELSSNRITPLMTSSGVDSKNIHNTTAYLARELYISKPKGGKSFKLTSKGEDYAKRILDDALAALKG